MIENNREGVWMKDAWVGFVCVFVCAAIMCGCETVKGTSKGFAGGVAKDAKNTAHNAVSWIAKADQWIKDTYW